MPCTCPSLKWATLCKVIYVLLNLLETSPYYLISSCFLLGLVIGSFLNVVIYRLPIMMQRDFTRQATDYLNSLNQDGNPSLDTTPDKALNQESFNLVIPNSRCPHCQHEISPLENIPLISFLFLRGKCSACQSAISMRYPMVELAGGLVSALLAWHFGFTWQLLAALIFTYAMLAQALIDWDTQYLLDDITFPILWLGLLVNTQHLFTSLEDAVLGAVIGYLSLWSIFWVYKLITGKEGMGYGDFKLMALLGAWMGWQFIPLIVLLSSLTGTVIGGTALLLSKQGSDKAIPFGPYIASAGWISLLWGNEIIDGYLGLMSL